MLRTLLAGSFDELAESRFRILELPAGVSVSGVLISHGKFLTRQTRLDQMAQIVNF